MSKGNGNSHGASNSQGPAIAGNANWELKLVLDSQPNQFRDGQ
jgi:hypothetical protein